MVCSRQSALIDPFDSFFLISFLRSTISLLHLAECSVLFSRMEQTICLALDPKGPMSDVGQRSIVKDSFGVVAYQDLLASFIRLSLFSSSREHPVVSSLKIKK